MQEPKCSSHIPMRFLKSDSKWHLTLCLCFSLSQIPQSLVPVGFCRILKNASFPLSFSIKHIYISWLGVLSKEYFIFFLIALFAFNFLNFHGLHGCVCRGLFVYTCVGWGFFCCMCWFHGHMIPTSCGSDWPGLVFLFLFLFFWKEWYLENKLHCKALIGSYERAGRCPWKRW